MLTLNPTDAPAASEYATVYVAFELSKAKWKLGVLLPGSRKVSRYTIDGGELPALAHGWRRREPRLRPQASPCVSCRAMKPVMTDTGCTGG